MRWTGPLSGRSVTTVPTKISLPLEDEITHAVAEALKTKLLPAEHASQQSERPPSGNLEAYNALLQGRFFASRHGSRFSHGDRLLYSGDRPRSALCPGLEQAGGRLDQSRCARFGGRARTAGV